jgi:ATP-binding cassette, subfamily B, multidrug efflux pump
MKPHSVRFVVAVGLLLYASVAKMLGPVILQQAIDRYILPGDFQGLSLLLGFYVILVMTGFTAHYWQLIQLESAGLQIIAALKGKAFEHLVHLDLPFFDQHTTGKLVSRIENDANAMKVLFSSVMSNVVSNLIMMVGMFGIMAWQYDLRLAAYVVGICPVILMAGIFFQRLMGPLLVKIRQRVSEVNGLLTEVIQGISTIQMFAQQQRFMTQIQQQSNEKNKLEGRMTIGFNSFFNVLFFTQNLALALVLWFGGNLVMDQQLTVGSLVLFMVFIRTFFGPIMFLSSQFNEFQKALAGAERIFALLAERPTVLAPFSPQPVPEGLWDISFEDVYFRYPDSERWVLEGLSFHCPAGEHWALVGATGSGKTTLISLLLRFYDPQQGRICINGIDIRELDMGALRQAMGLVLQDVIFFPGSLWQNLVLDKPLDRAHVEQVLTRVGLHQRIQALPEGYNTPLQEGAHNLSEGEQQLLSFGRALLHNPRVLILDEATSHIDPETEGKIQSAMHTVLEGRTALIIAHRLRTIEAADRILVLHHGRLIESGAHQELLQRGGHYAYLHQLQAQHV